MPRNREKANAQHRDWCRRFPHKRKAHKLRSELKCDYGITMTDYNRMMAEQCGLCKICHERQPEGNRLAVDHCHLTGRVRGLLCGRCNMSIGQFSDDPCMLRRAAEYLEENG